MHKSTARTLTVVLLVVGVVLVVIGVVYFAVPANELPSLLGQRESAGWHRTTRGGVAIGLGLVSLIVAGLTYARAGRGHHLSH
jgi:hypothetical protein